MSLSYSPMPIVTAPIITLEQSEECNGTESWNITPAMMKQVLTVLTSSAAKKSESTSNSIQLMGQWIQRALQNQLKMDAKPAEQLAILMERSALIASGGNAEAWQKYYSQRNRVPLDDKSWIVSREDMQKTCEFLNKGIDIDRKHCVPYFAGLSDDKKTIYFDHRTPNILTTSQGDVSVTDFVVLHERVEGAMLEQSFVDQLQKPGSSIRFECPLPDNSGNHCKAVASYTLENGELKLSYQVEASTAEANAMIPSMNEQAIRQGVLSYEFAHQIAERLERAAIYASGFGAVWENEYNQPVMVCIGMLAQEYKDHFSRGANLPGLLPPGLYIIPYMQYVNEQPEMYVFNQLFHTKRYPQINMFKLQHSLASGFFNAMRGSSAEQARFLREHRNESDAIRHEYANRFGLTG